MGIFDITYSLQTRRLLPPFKRLPKWIAWMASLVRPLQWLSDLSIKDYRTGITGLILWDSVSPYSKGDRVLWFDGAVYEALEDTAIGESPIGSEKWYKVLDTFVGAEERVLFNGQTVILEYALNAFMGTNFVQPNYINSVELTNDPTFSNGGTWYEGGPSPFTTTAGYVDVASKAGDNISTATFAQNGKTYLIEIVVVSNNGDANVRSGGSELIGTISSPGTYSYIYTKTTTFQRFGIVANGSEFVVSKFSVKETNRRSDIFIVNELTDDNSFLVGLNSPDTSFVAETASLTDDFVGLSFSALAVNFTVYYPTAFTQAQVERLIAYTEKYKLYGSTPRYVAY